MPGMGDSLICTHFILMAERSCHADLPSGICKILVSRVRKTSYHYSLRGLISH